RRPDTTVEEPRIVWEDEEGGLAVLFKPPGWEVDDDTSVPTGRKLSEYLQGRYPQSCISRDAHHCHGIIHRLDLPSSGLILVGTSFEGYYRLKWQLDTAQIVREYAVVCHGWANPLLREIDVPVYHVAAGSAAESAQPPRRSPARSTVTEMGKPAKTLLRVLGHLSRGEERFSLLAIRICTGRRHQIRTHLQHVGHPTVCDGKYTRASVFIADLSWCPRNFLHRQRLEFRDAQHLPREAIEPLPVDLRNALRKLRPVGEESRVAVCGWLEGHKPMPWDQYEVLEAAEGVAYDTHPSALARPAESACKYDMARPGGAAGGE
ncbi:unnamed protein product, partial [Polarella glacialis]